MDSVIIPQKAMYIKESNFTASLNNTSFSYNFTQKGEMILILVLLQHTQKINK